MSPAPPATKIRPTPTPEFEQGYYYISPDTTLEQDTNAVWKIIDEIHARGRNAVIVVCAESSQTNFFGEDALCVPLLFRRAR